MNQFHFVFLTIAWGNQYGTACQILQNRFYQKPKNYTYNLQKKGTLGNLTKQRKIKRIANIKVEVVKCM